MSRSKGLSWLIRPIIYTCDLLFIISFLFWFLTNSFLIIKISVILWFLISVASSFYNVYRFTKLSKIITILNKQIFVFYLFIISILYFINIKIPLKDLIVFFVIFYFSLSIWRAFIFFILRKYRKILGGNFKRVVFIGKNSTTSRLIDFFQQKPEYGYKIYGNFLDKKQVKPQESLESCFNFIKENNIDEVYCSLKEFSNAKIIEIIDFCDRHLVTLKFLPDQKGVNSKKMHFNFYGIIPVLSLRQIPLDSPINTILKRAFDIVFSTIVVIFVLSWLIPLIGILIKIESKGPVFFKQNRPGINEKGFVCYKFRSMAVNKTTELSATRNDARVTKIGRFIRKTSLDEMPQFFNVLLGSMSVVGPRPHLWRQNEIYGPSVSKYMVRHLVKPGITGLAQVNGYRGEIESNDEIINRTKYDVFYIENWTMFLDLNIIIRTILNIFKGEEKAY